MCPCLALTFRCLDFITSFYYQVCDYYHIGIRVHDETPLLEILRI